MKKRLITIILCGLLVILSCGFSRSDAKNALTSEELDQVNLEKSVVITVKATSEEIVLFPLKDATEERVNYMIEYTLEQENLTEDDVTISSLE